MEKKIGFFVLCSIGLLSCDKHSCLCVEYHGKDEIKQYEKSLSATKASTCEDLNAYYFNGKDTVKVICGESNPL
ncbi:MAG: hypothetical protein WC142_00355 [Bacteroidales bacterium]|jgi:hypothetical protein|nr:hypothetical protein [Bacteroidales bacterium]MDD2687291.1 hypothetical protein [Bacteroidales bacterium]MDD3329886.1 hypothetical protein [Bacteroidales bacterium]MDD3691850.1 hypothetical protein [Bacteroidales bacterium]MDD4045287.1 hypothetical protein [Bacteroidales bacterium]